MRKKIRIVLIVLLVIWMFVVFGLSQQNGEESGNLSRKVAMFFAGGNVQKAETIEPLIRKVAHMTEYAVGAIIFYGIMLTYESLAINKRIIFTLIFVILYAISDEYHQYFINARNGNVWDVLIDISGGVIGTVGMVTLCNMLNFIDNQIEDKTNNSK